MMGIFSEEYYFRHLEERKPESNKGCFLAMGIGLFILFIIAGEQAGYWKIFKQAAKVVIMFFVVGGIFLAFTSGKSTN